MILCMWVPWNLPKLDNSLFLFLPYAKEYKFLDLNHVWTFSKLPLAYSSFLSRKKKGNVIWLLSCWNLPKLHCHCRISIFSDVLLRTGWHKGTPQQIKLMVACEVSSSKVIQDFLIW